MRLVALGFCLCAAAPAALAQGDAIKVENYISEITNAIPRTLMPVRIGETDKPMQSDALAYARFYWMADSIEQVCDHLGQRSNIEMLDPGLLITGWVSVAMIANDHPNHTQYIEMYYKIEGMEEDLGQPAFCSLAYRLLGPNGTMVEPTMRINSFMADENRETYEIRPEDGVIWSSRDYCERQYFLSPPAQKDMHDYICKEAESQPF